MNWLDILSAVAALAFGLIMAYVNMRLSRAHMNSQSVASIMGANMLRLLIDIAALAAAFFVSRALKLSVTVMLIAVALGLSVGGMVMLRLMIKKSQPHEKEADGGEKY